MEVSAELAKCFSGANKLDDKLFKSLLELAVKQILNPGGKKLPQQTIPGLDEPGQLVGKAVYAGIVSFLLEAARADVSGASFSSQLQETELSAPQVELMTAVLAAKKAAIQKVLKLVGFKFPQVIGLDWRLDYQLRSSTVGKMGSHVYFLKMKTLNKDGVPEMFEFTCNVEQLKDLLSKVQDAKKQLDRVMKAIR